MKLPVLTSGLTVLSPGKVYYGHNTDIYVIDSSLVAKYTWNKCEISTLYSWNRFNLATTYKWNRYTVEQTPKYYISDDTDPSDYYSEAWGFDYGCSITFAADYDEVEGTHPKITFSGRTTLVRQSSESELEYYNRLADSGFIGSYFVNWRERQTTGIYSIATDDINMLENSLATVYKCTNIRFNEGNTNFICNHDCLKFRRENNGYNNSQGSYVDQVTSSSSGTYPSDGQSGSYWYVSAGSTTSKGSANGSVTSTNASAYPADGASGSYWYTSSGSTQQAGTVLGSVESYDSSAYPDNGILDGYWYVKQ